MNTLEINKIVGAVLATALAAMVVSFIGDILIPEGAPHVTGTAGEHGAPAAETAPAPAEPEVATPAEPELAAVPPIAERLARADLEAGAKVVKKCLGCHSVAKGGANKIGPALWGVVGRDKGAVDGFNYSGGLKDAGGTWGYGDLDAFLANPKASVPGTKMPFKLKKPQDRANAILYLRSQSDSPPPLPGQ